MSLPHEILGVEWSEFFSILSILAMGWVVFNNMVIKPKVDHAGQDAWRKAQDEWRKDMDDWRMEVVLRLEELRHQAHYTSGQLRTNGGSTALDAVLRIEKKLAQLLPEEDDQTLHDPATRKERDNA